MPHCGKLGVAKDDVDDAGTVNGWVGVDGSSNLLDAAHNDLLLGLTAADGRVATGTLTVETEVLGERLEEHDIVGMLSEQLQRVAVLLEITRGESLVGTIESREELLALDDFENFLPLGVCGINSGGVVSTDVEHDDGVVLGVVKILLEAIEVEALGFLAVVAVVLPLVTNEVGNGSVDGPCGVGNQEVDILVGVPLGEEGETEAKSSCARDRLGTGNSVFLAGLVILTVSEGEALIDVGLDTMDGSVLVIHAALENDLLSASDAREDEWLVVIISVGSHAQEDLLGVGLLLVGIVEAENGICGGRSQS